MTSSSVAKSRIGTFKIKYKVSASQMHTDHGSEGADAQDLKRACARVKGVRAPKGERIMMIQKRLQPRISQNDK